MQGRTYSLASRQINNEVIIRGFFEKDRVSGTYALITLI